MGATQERRGGNKVGPENDEKINFIKKFIKSLASNEILLLQNQDKRDDLFAM